MATAIAVSLWMICANAEESPRPWASKPAEIAKAPAKEPSRLLFNPSWSEGLVWRTVDDHLQLRVGAYVMFDWGSANQDGSLDGIAAPVGTGSEIRDFQIEVRGRLYNKTLFRLQFDVDDGKAEVQDNYFERGEIMYVGRIRFGHFKEPFGLENTTSSRNLVFMERSLTDTLTPARGVGISLANTFCEERLTWNLGAFFDTNSVEKISESRAFSLVGRLTGVALRNDEKRELLHVGVSCGLRSLKSALRYEARPEVNSAPRYLDTGDFSAETMSLFNLESAYSRGPLLLQGECIWNRASGGMGAEDVTWNAIADEAADWFPKLVEWLRGHSGWERPSDSVLWNIPFDLSARGDLSFFGVYGQVSYILTGEQRPYDVSSGVFGAPVPEHPFSFRKFRGLGAWEVAARLSRLDLTDAYMDGGRETNVTLGVNWYMNRNMRMAFNYVHGKVERDEYEGSVDAVQMRLQIDFQPRDISEYHPLRSIKKTLSRTPQEENE